MDCSTHGPRCFLTPYPNSNTHTPCGKLGKEGEKKVYPQQSTQAVIHPGHSQPELQAHTPLVSTGDPRTQSQATHVSSTSQVLHYCCPPVASQLSLLHLIQIIYPGPT